MTTPAPGAMKCGKTRLMAAAAAATPADTNLRSHSRPAISIVASTAPQAPSPARSWPASKPGRAGPNSLACASLHVAPPMALITRTLPASTTRQLATAAATSSHSSRSRRPRRGSAQSSTAHNHTMGKTGVADCRWSAAWPATSYRVDQTVCTTSTGSSKAATGHQSQRKVMTRLASDRALEDTDDSSPPLHPLSARSRSY
jgi:hypothetical protein